MECGFQYFSHNPLLSEQCKGVFESGETTKLHGLDTHLREYRPLEREVIVVVDESKILSRSPVNTYRNVYSLSN
jgi:hypothetical protein